MAQIQANRQAKFQIDEQDEDFLILQRLEGSEGINELFEFQLVVLGDKKTRIDIDLNKLLGRHAQVELEAADDGKRWFCGNVTSMSFVGFRDDQLAIYEIRLRPWLWFLTRTRNSRIFQNLTAPEIIKKVFDEHGLSDYLDELGHEEYEARDYCVQYRESDFDFVSRLMEEEGIHYYFRHENGKHVLILADDSTVHEPLSAAHQGVSSDLDAVAWDPDPEGGPGLHIHDWRMQREIRIESVELRDYNYMQPNLMLAKSKVQESETFAGPGSVSLEHYDYPARFPQYDSEQISSDLTRVAAIRKEEMLSEFELLAGQGSIRTLVPGFLFKLANHDRKDQVGEYLVSTTRHELSLPEYDHSGSGVDGEVDYRVTLTAVSSGITYQPMRKTPQPIVHGPQTAVVVGPEGKEIDIDDHGRVKVQFHWDRHGSNDENSSCRLRVSQAWAGKGWGAFFFPRIGHEVIVEFLEGNPDRPIITGAVYNGENKPPIELPTNDTQSGMRTQSTPMGKGKGFNELRFEDNAGREQIYIHAEKDMDTEIGNDQSIEIGNHQELGVHGNRMKWVGITEESGPKLGCGVGKGGKEKKGYKEKKREKEKILASKWGKKVGKSGNELNIIEKHRRVEIGETDHLKINKDWEVSVGNPDSPSKIPIGIEGSPPMACSLHVEQGIHQVSDNVAIQTQNSAWWWVGNEFELTADKDVKITSRDRKVKVKAKKEIKLDAPKVSIEDSSYASLAAFVDRISAVEESVAALEHTVSGVSTAITGVDNSFNGMSNEFTLLGISVGLLSVEFQLCTLGVTDFDLTFTGIEIAAGHTLLEK